MSTLNPLLHLVGPNIVVIAFLVSGCTTTPGPDTSAVIEQSIQAQKLAEIELIPVVRYGRYTLVELAPLAGQRDLLLQVVDVYMPEDARQATVGDGLRHVLKRSGYQLCETAPAVNDLYSQPLPAAHRRLGPATLRDVLLTLAGPAWDLQVYERTRRICFARPNKAPITQGLIKPTSIPARTLPAATGGRS